mgnify:CR=1 FL=1
MDPNQIPVACVYHADCVDGTTAAALVLKRFPHVTLFPLSHRAPEKINPLLSTLPPSALVYMVDTTTAADVILAAGHRLTIIDHHASTEEKIRDWINDGKAIEFFYDSLESAATLTHKILFPTVTMSELLKYVRDSDLWSEQFSETKHVVNYLSTFRNQPAVLLERLSLPAPKVIEYGEIITNYIEASLARHLSLPPIKLSLGEHLVSAYNITDHESLCGNLLAKQNGCATVMFTIMGEKVKFSFRSLPGQNPTALKLATLTGGGGHEHSAGGEMTLGDFLQAIQVATSYNQN